MDESENRNSEFEQKVDAKERRKLKAKRAEKKSSLEGFSVFGVIGWSVAVPTVLFVLIGFWLDERYSGERSYTLALLLAGLTLGIFNAWYWVDKKRKEIYDEDQK